MKRGKYIRTDGIKDKCRKSHKGIKNSLGKHWKLSDKAKENISNGHYGLKHSKETKKKIGRKGDKNKNWKGGKPKCLDCGKLLSNYNNKRCSICSKKGNNSPMWKGGITKERVKIWFSNEYKIWRKLVFKRDNYICKKCNKRSRKGKRLELEAHHIKLFSTFPEFRFDVKNGITLCKKCHNKTKRKEKDFEKLFNKIVNLYDI